MDSVGVGDVVIMSVLIELMLVGVVALLIKGFLNTSSRYCLV